MALRDLNPFSYEKFVSEAGQTISEMVHYFMKKETGFWRNLLERYNFDNMDYQKGEEIRLKFNDKIKSAQNIDEIFAVSDEILGWGRMRPLSENMKKQLQQSLDLVDALSGGQDVNLDNLCVERLASITKIYEMWDLDNWIIYDSFCVRGLQRFISEFWKSKGKKMNESLLKLPWPPGRSGSPEEGFPKLGGTPSNQGRLGLIYGSWLCKFIAEELNNSSPEPKKWRTFHIEMIAFQRGH